MYMHRHRRHFGSSQLDAERLSQESPSFLYTVCRVYHRPIPRPRRSLTAPPSRRRCKAGAGGSPQEAGSAARAGAAGASGREGYPPKLIVFWNSGLAWNEF